MLAYTIKTSGIRKEFVNVGKMYEAIVMDYRADENHNLITFQEFVEHFVTFDKPKKAKDFFTFIV